MQSLVAGDHFVVTFPGYQSLYELGKSRGAELSQWTVRETEHGLRFAIEVRYGQSFCDGDVFM
jgi:hypothetical protein